MKMIDIVLTGNGSLEKSLFSISIQTIKDLVHVIVVSNQKHSFLSEFQKKISIEEVVTKEKSVGSQRKVGYEKTKNEYVFFMNAGDVFYDVFALNNLYKIREKNDIIIGGIENIEKKYSTYYLVGNLYKRSSLKSHRMVFRESNGLENGFHQLFFMTHPKIVYSNDIIYYQNVEFVKDYEYYRNLIEDSKFAVEKAKNRSYSSSDIARLLYDVVLEFSYLFHEGWEELLDSFQPLWKEYQKYQKSLKEEDIQYISDINLTNRAVDESYLAELESKNRL